MRSCGLNLKFFLAPDQKECQRVCCLPSRKWLDEDQDRNRGKDRLRLQGGIEIQRRRWQRNKSKANDRSQVLALPLPQNNGSVKLRWCRPVRSVGPRSRRDNAE